MTKLDKNIKIIEPVTEQDYREVKTLIDEIISPTEVDSEYLHFFPLGGIYLAKIDSVTVGVILSRLPDHYFRELPERFTSFDKIKVPRDKIGNIHVIAVDVRYRGIGIGKKLLKKALSYLKNSGVNAVVSHIWMQSPNNSSYKLFSSFGFKPLTLFKKAWSSFSDHTCVRCGSPCQCDFLEMIKYL